MSIKSFRQNSTPQIKSTLSLVLIILSFHHASGASIPSTTSSIENETKSNSQKICLKQECIHAANEIQKTIDEGVNPCDNFYNFACGNFMNSTHVPNTANFVDSYSILAKETEFKLKEILEGDENYVNSVNIETPKRAYKMCMNITDVEQNGLKRLKKVLSDLGGMPILMENDWSEKEFDLFELIHRLRTMGYPFEQLISIKENEDFQNPTRYALQITRPKVNPINIRSVYKIQERKMRRIFSILNVDKSLMSNEIKDMLDFQLKLTNINSSRYLKVDINSNQSFNSSQMFLKLASKLLPHNVTGSLYVDRVYLNSFTNLISDTPKRVLANYVLWDIIIFSMKNLFVTDFNKRFTLALRNEACIAMIIKIFPNLQTAYLKTFLTEKRLHSAEAYVKHVHKAVLDIVQNRIWRNESTKKEIIERIENIKKFVAYSDIYTERDDEMKSTFDESMKNGVFQEFYLKALKVEADKKIGRWGTTVHKSTWNMLQTQTNSIFNCITNSLFIAGLLRGNIFNENVPSYLNYGGLGFYAGHTVSNSITPSCLQYNNNGVFDVTLYNKMAEEFSETFSCLTMPKDNNTDENRYLTDDIADLVGIKASYIAYINSDMANEMEPLLPGLNYNQRQLFWINHASSRCAKHNPLYLEETIATRAHRLSEARILRTFSNLDEFSKDFNCPIGSRMNPKDKCLL